MDDGEMPARTTLTGKTRKARTGAKRRVHSAEKRAEVLAAVLVGERPADIAEKHGVGLTQVYDWANRHLPGGMEHAQIEAVGQLALDFLKESLRTLAIQVRHAGTEEFIGKLDGQSFAAQYAAIADRTIRLLAALERARESRGSGTPPPGPITAG